MNRLTQITQGPSIVTFTYDAAGRRTSLTLPNGVLIEYAYDAASRLTEINYKKGATALGNLTYTYDKAGNRTQTGGSFARTGIPQAISTSNYDAANHQLALGDRTMTFDNNGNLTSITDASGTTIYSWNARNQLTGISGPGVSASFVYDGLGRREKKTINSSLTEFLYDGVNPVQETSGATVLANILGGLGIDEYFTRADIPAATTSHSLPDALGSALALADSAGVVQTEYTYEPFGKTTVSGASNTNPFQFTGRENDSTGLYFYRARYYHPQLQRFLSEDPIEFAGGDVNLYAYVMNNPTNFADPLGEANLKDFFKKVGPAIAKFLPRTGGAIDKFLNPDPLFHDDDGDGLDNFADPDSNYCRVNCDLPQETLQPDRSQLPRLPGLPPLTQPPGFPPRPPNLTPPGKQPPCKTKSQDCPEPK